MAALGNTVLKTISRASPVEMLIYST